MLGQNYTIEIKNWNGLICLANPEINLYVEPLNVSNIKQDSDIHKLSFYDNLTNIEKKYLLKIIKKL